MLNLQRARALQYADHPEGATGMVVKDYRGQKAQKEIWKFDAALMTQILHTLKQAAIEVGDWGAKREPPIEAMTIPGVTVIFPPKLQPASPVVETRAIRGG